jgi:integrase
VLDRKDAPVQLQRQMKLALRTHRARQAEERLRLGVAWTDLDLVFANTLGGPYDASNLRNWFYRMLKRAGLPRVRFHDLRHTAATLLLARGVNVKVVSEMLGHANVGITLSIYGHVLPHMQQQAADTMDALLRGSPLTRPPLMRMPRTAVVVQQRPPEAE